jgi:hypothetical protein
MAARTIYFGANETDLMDYYDTGGRSALVKVALSHYRRNTGKALSKEMCVEILKLLDETGWVCDRCIHPVNGMINYKRVTRPEEYAKQHGLC